MEPRPASRTTSPRARTLALAALLCAAFAAPALATDDLEPNDSQAEAAKLRTGSGYEAEIRTLDDAVNQRPGDTDWYMLDAAAGPVEIAYTAQQTQGSCFGPEARLLNEAGETLGSAQPPKGGTEAIRYTATSDAPLYIRVQAYRIDSCNAPIPYRIQPQFTEVQSGGGAIAGLVVKAKSRQRQRGKRVRVKLEATAAERIDLVATGTVKAGGKKLKLRRDRASAAADRTVKLALSARGKAAKRITAAIAGRGPVTAKIKVEVSGQAGNSAVRGLAVGLR